MSETHDAPEPDTLIDRHVWQLVCVDGPAPEDPKNIYTHRMRRPGGWLYRVMGIYLQYAGGNTIALTFVPDPHLEPPDGGWGSP